MSTNRPTRIVNVIAIAVTVGLAILALALAFVGPRPWKHSHEAPGRSERVAELLNTDAFGQPERRGGSKAEVSGSAKACTVSASRSRICYPGGKGIQAPTRERNTLQPVTDGDPAPFPGRVPGRGGWVGERGMSAA